jgi:multiple sugar transport system permease protein
MSVKTVPTTGQRITTPRFRLRKWTPYLLLTPAFAFLAVILIYPGIYNFWLSLWRFRYTNLEESRFVGLANYQRMLFEDPQFGQVFQFTMLFVFCTIGLEFVFGLGSALLLNRITVLRSLFTGISIMPYQVAPIAAGLIWRLLWAHDFGLINYGIEQVGLEPVAWLGLAKPAVVAVIVTEVWRSMPFVTIILLAGLTSIPTDIVEAAEVDGASALQRFLRVIFPLLLPSIAVALMFETIFKLRVFDLIYNLTGGGPGIATMPLGILIYRTYFRYFDGGYSATISVLLLILGAILSLLYIRLVYRETEF